MGQQDDNENCHECLKSLNCTRKGVLDDIEATTANYYYSQDLENDKQPEMLNLFPCTRTTSTSNSEKAGNSPDITEVDDEWLLIRNVSKVEVHENDDEGNFRISQSARNDNFTSPEPENSGLLSTAVFEWLKVKSIWSILWTTNVHDFTRPETEQVEDLKEEITCPSFKTTEETEEVFKYVGNYVAQCRSRKPDLLSREPLLHEPPLQELFKLLSAMCCYTPEDSEVCDTASLWNMLKQLQVTLPERISDTSVRAFWREVSNQPGLLSYLGRIQKQTSTAPTPAKVDESSLCPDVESRWETKLESNYHNEFSDQVKLDESNTSTEDSALRRLKENCMKAVEENNLQGDEALLPQSIERSRNEEEPTTLNQKPRCYDSNRDALVKRLSNQVQNEERLENPSWPGTGISNRSCPFLAGEPCVREIFMHEKIMYQSEKKIWVSRKSVIDLVREHATNQVYARKTLRAGDGTAPTKIEYERELQIMQLLSGFKVPHTTRLKSWSTNAYSLVMYPVAECSLRQYLERPRDSQRGNLIKWVGCLASAIHFLHSPEINVTHGDVKPANILIQGSKVFLADFGESKIESPGQNKPQAGGRFTVMYSAPEVLEQGVRSKSNDIWALGCVFAEMFTVICNGSYQNYHKMLNRCSNTFTDFPAHKARLRAILTWVQDLSSFCTAGQCSGRYQYGSVSNSIAQMLEPCPEDRIDARQVLSLFPHSLDDCSVDTMPVAPEIDTFRPPNSGRSGQTNHQNRESFLSRARADSSAPTSSFRCEEIQRPSQGANQNSKTVPSVLQQSKNGTGRSTDDSACPAKEARIDFPSLSEAPGSPVEPKVYGGYLQVPTADIASVAGGQESSRSPRGRKRERSTSSASGKPGAKPGAPPEKCQVRIAVKERESQEKGAQPSPRRIVLQVSRQTRDHILQALSRPGRSSLYFIPLTLTPKYS